MHNSLVITQLVQKCDSIIIKIYSNRAVTIIAVLAKCLNECITNHSDTIAMLKISQNWEGNYYAVAVLIQYNDYNYTTEL